MSVVNFVEEHPGYGCAKMPAEPPLVLLVGNVDEVADRLPVKIVHAFSVRLM